jgi:mannitol/fructose-specific phosphotransferase system IIA component (Ntr-type)
MTLGMVAPVLDPALFIPDLRPRTRQAVLEHLASLAHEAGAVGDPALLCDLLVLRERAGGTALGKGVALPHARSLTVRRPMLVVARSQRGIDWDAADQQRVTLVILALSPGEWGDEAHHAFLARAASLVRLQRHRQRLLEAESVEDVVGVLRDVKP